jgi:hypothetical protein
MSFRVGSREREFRMPGGVAHRGQVVRGLSLGAVK